jgi:hypothetical protein
MEKGRVTVRFMMLVGNIMGGFAGETISSFGGNTVKFSVYVT